MQGSFPLEPRPTPPSPSTPSSTEDEVLAPRPAPARRAHHPPGHADLRHARARLRLDARRRQGRSRAPVARREDHQLAPRRLHNYLRNHEFNMWFTLAVEERLAARPAGHARRPAGADRRRVDPPAADAEALQDPHGPRDGGRHRVAVDRGRREAAGRARASSPTTSSTRASSARRRATCRSSPSPTRAAAERLGIDRRATLLEHLAGHEGARPAAPRRRDPLPPPRRLLRQRHGRLEGARRPHRRSSARGWRPSAASRTATSARPTRTGRTQIFTMAHGRSKEECDAILDAIADEFGIDERATLYSLDRVQEDPPAVLHRRLHGLGARARGRLSPRDSLTVSLRDTRSAELYAARSAYLPGRRQLARARDARDRPRPALRRPRARAPSSSTSTATATSTGSARGAR